MAEIGKEGRTASSHTVMVTLRIPEPLRDALDDIVASRLDGADRSTVILEILADGVTRWRALRGKK